MAKSQETFNKKEKEKKRLKKRQDKQKKKEERRASNAEQGDTGSMDNMIAYVDENGQITDTPPDPTKKKVEVEAENIVLGVPKKEEGDEEPTDFTGKITFFNTDKGYGFIKDQNSQESYFVHVNGLLEECGEGDKVVFELERGQKGMNAVRVKKV